MDFEDFVGVGSMIAPGAGVVEDDEGREYAEVAKEAALDGGRTVRRDVLPGVDVLAYEGDDMESVVAVPRDDPSAPAVGCYEGISLWVAPEWRGRGVGERLVVEAAKVRGGSPVADAAPVAFSEAGWRTHEKGFDLYVEECSPDPSP